MKKIDVNGPNNNTVGAHVVVGLHENIKHLYLPSRKVCAAEVTKIPIRTIIKIGSSKDKSIKINFRPSKTRPVIMRSVYLNDNILVLEGARLQ